MHASIPSLYEVTSNCCFLFFISRMYPKTGCVSNHERVINITKLLLNYYFGAPRAL